MLEHRPIKLLYRQNIVQSVHKLFILAG
jgi:hypothetical protein